MAEENSVTYWIEQLQAGVQGTAAQEVWNRYYERLIEIAQARLRHAPQREEDEEDAVLNAFDTFFRRVRQGQFPNLEDRTSLWPLLVTITARKASNQRRRASAQKRRTIDPSDRVGSPSSWPIEELQDNSPTPELAAEAAEEARHLLVILDKDSHRRVAELKLAGFTNCEIAEQLGVIERTVERRLALIRVRWADYGDSMS